MTKLIIPKPITPSQRHLIKISNKALRKKPFIKSNLTGIKTSSGRNNSGKITVRHKGGGHKKKYRRIDFYRVIDSEGIICTLEYDPNRNTNVASVYNYITKHFCYILAPKNLKVGDIVTFKGQVTLNKDFGYGYIYPILIEDGKRVKETIFKLTSGRS